MGQWTDDDTADYEGFDAYDAGEPRAANPYSARTPERRVWNEAWDAEKVRCEELQEKLNNG